MLAFIVRTDDVKRIMGYPGGKSRCFHNLVNLIPPHRVYIETHLGGGAVLRHKKAAAINYGLDRDPCVIRKFAGHGGPNFHFITSTAEAWLPQYNFVGDEFVYADPPYWPAARRASRSPYRFDYTEAQHIELLAL